MNSSASSNTWCSICPGLIMEPNKPYSYSGPVCTCSWKQIATYPQPPYHYPNQDIMASRYDIDQILNKLNNIINRLETLEGKIK